MTNSDTPTLGFAGEDLETLSTDERAPLLLDQADLLATDDIPENDEQTITSVSAASAQGGVVALIGDVVVYNPGDIFGDLAEGDTRTDTFTYTFTTEGGGTDSATATVIIVGVNDGPLITPQVTPIELSETDEDHLVLLDSFVLDAEDDPIAYAISGFSSTINGQALSITLGDVFGIGFNFDPETNRALFMQDNLAELIGLGANETLSVSFDFEVVDVAVTGRRSEQNLTISANISGVDDAPIANADSIETDEDVSFANGQLVATEADGDTLTFALSDNGGPVNGTVSISETGSYSYTPNDDFNGADSFAFEVRDETGNFDTAEISITVRAANDAPVASDASTSGFEDQENAIDGQLFASDIEGDDLTFSLVSDDGSTNGAVTISEDGFYSYSVEPNFFGDDTFTYQVDDGNGGVSTATVTVSIAAAPDDPVGLTTDLSVDEGGILLGQLEASDPDGQTDLIFAIVSEQGIVNGTLALSAAGVVTYVPSADFNGVESFTYSVEDEDGRSTVQTATIVVNNINDAPTATDANRTVAEDNVLQGILSAEDIDGDSLTFSVAVGGGPENGQLAIEPDGSFTYSPDADFNGTDDFAFVVSDGEGGSDTATLSVTVTPVNDAPLSESLSILVDEDESVSGQLIATDIDSDALTFRLASGGAPKSGMVSVSAAGAFSFTPNADFNGEDRFTYLVADGSGGEATQTAIITVAPVNDLPVVQDSSLSAFFGLMTTGQLEATDIDGDMLTYSLDLNAGPVEGAVMVSSDGSFTYAPATGGSASDQFGYIVSDGSGGQATGVVNIDLLAASEGTDGGDFFTGDGSNDAFNGRGGDDSLIGGGGRDDLSGGGGKDLLQGNGGKDLLKGNGGRDTLEGGGGRDTLEGGGGRDMLDGGGGKDLLDGGGGKDTMEGGGGKDEIIGGRGSDILTGGGGGDRFVFDRGNGRDTITDFQQNRDKIVVEGGADGFNALEISQVGSDVRIQIGNTRVTVEDDSIANFTATDFIF